MRYVIVLLLLLLFGFYLVNGGGGWVGSEFQFLCGHRCYRWTISVISQGVR